MAPRKIPKADASTPVETSTVDTKAKKIPINQTVKTGQVDINPLNVAYEEDAVPNADREAAGNQLNVFDTKQNFKAVGESARLGFVADDRQQGLKDLDTIKTGEGEGVNKASEKIIQATAAELAYKSAPTQGVSKVTKATWDTLTAKVRDLESKSSALEQYVLEKRERAKMKEMLRKELFKMGVGAKPDAAYIGAKEKQVDEEDVDKFKNVKQKGAPEPLATGKEVDKAINPVPAKKKVWL